MIKKESKYRISITANMNKLTIKLQYPAFHEECFWWNLVVRFAYPFKVILNKEDRYLSF